MQVLSCGVLMSSIRRCRNGEYVRNVKKTPVHRTLLHILLIRQVVRQRHSCSKARAMSTTKVQQPWHLALIAALLLMGGCRTLPLSSTLSYQRGEFPLQITSIGHATFLIELHGQRILTDPWFYETPFTGQHPDPFGLSLEQLPPLDLILVTHTHIDHFDRRALKRLVAQTRAFVGVKGMGEPMRKLGFSHVIGLAPWETFAASPLTITAVPAAHSGPTNSYIIERGGKTVYFAGETTFFPDLVRISEHLPRLDIAVLPVDGLRLRWGKQLAMDAHDAVEAVQLLRPRVVIPVLDHDFSRSLAGLVLTTTSQAEAFKALMEKTHPEVAVVLLKAGGQWRLNERF